MRLLRTGPYLPGNEKLEIIEKWGHDIPPYAILSHTWSSNAEEEVLLSDVLNGNYERKPAYTKLKKAIERAKLDGYGWLWIDTCCIDKTSSVELSEAINSMYSYYTRSQKCYAYLAEVTDTMIGGGFWKARWWKRGWTLQELLAPSQLEFFNSDWISLGSRRKLHATVAQISGISPEYLSGEMPVEHASVAQRMSWAARRETTREEDMAYSLIGLFDVNMPLLYGEGGIKAFVRLQEEILRSNEDQSLFAWTNSNRDQAAYHGLLADSPRDFALVGDVVPYSETGDHIPATMTARGLNITFPLTPKEGGTMVAALQCPVPRRNQREWLAVYLQPLRTGKDQYARIDAGKLASVSGLGQPTNLYVRQHFPSFPVQTRTPYNYFQLRNLRVNSEHAELRDLRVVDCKSAGSADNQKVIPSAPQAAWSSVSLVHQVHWSAQSVSVAFLLKRSHDKEAFVVLLGACSDSEVGATACDTAALAPIEKMESLFSPVAPGTFIFLEHHRIRFSFEELVRRDQKVFFVDIDVDCYAKPPDASEMFQSALDMLENPIRSKPRVAFLDKAKRLLPNTRS